VENSGLALDGSLSFSVRPKDDFRVYGKTKMYLPLGLTAANGDNYQAFIAALASGQSSQSAALAAQQNVMSGTTSYVPNLKIWELFSDFDINKTIYMRVGKQMAKWGTFIYQFWSPGDLINTGAIDYNNRGADREGPVAIKTSFPFGLNLIEAYVIVPANQSLTTVKDVELAGRAQFVVSGWELGIGASYQRSDEPKVIATVNGSLGDVAIFGEALYHWKAKGLFLEQRPYTSYYVDSAGVPQLVNYGYSIVRERTGGFFQGTVGVNYNVPDIYMTILGQYYFNGAGSPNISATAYDTAKYTANSYNPGYKGDKLSYSDLISMAMGNTGMHYAAVSISETFVKDSKVTFSTYWVGNLSDGSGMVVPNVSIKITDYLILGLNTTLAYGPENSQYIGIRQAASQYARDSGQYSVNALANQLDMSKISLGITMTMGTGEF
jgi:hypothetical protein